MQKYRSKNDALSGNDLQRNYKYPTSITDS